MGNSWTGGRRRFKKKSAPKVKTLIVTSPLLFAKRDKRGDLPQKDIEWSEIMIREVAKKWPKVLIFCSVDSETLVANRNAPPNDLLNLLKSLNLPNVLVRVYSATDPEEATAIWKQSIIDLGGSYKPAKNPREVIYLSMQRHFDAPHLTWVGQLDHKKAKVEIDKPKTFNDLQNIRKKKAEW